MLIVDTCVDYSARKYNHCLQMKAVFMAMAQYDVKWLLSDVHFREYQRRSESGKDALAGTFLQDFLDRGRVHRVALKKSCPESLNLLSKALECFERKVHEEVLKDIRKDLFLLVTAHCFGVPVVSCDDRFPSQLRKASTCLEKVTGIVWIHPNGVDWFAVLGNADQMRELCDCNVLADLLN